MKRIVPIVAIAAIALFVGAYFTFSNTALTNLGDRNSAIPTEEHSLEVARQFIRNSPTFKFDGVEESLELVDTWWFSPDIPDTWEFIFAFKSRYTGYGDRKNQGLLRIETFHIADIIVQEGEIYSAIIDGGWDMIKQEIVSSQALFSFGCEVFCVP